MLATDDEDYDDDDDGGGYYEYKKGRIRKKEKFSTLYYVYISRFTNTIR